MEVRSVRTAHCLKLGSREMGSKVSRVTMLGEVEGHEDLARGDDAGDVQFKIGDGSAAAHIGRVGTLWSRT